MKTEKYKRKSKNRVTLGKPKMIRSLHSKLDRRLANPNVEMKA